MLFRSRSSAGVPVRASSPMCWSTNTLITCHCIAKARSSTAKALIWIARRWRIGQAKSTALLEPLAAAIGRHVLAGQAIFADDTPVAMLAPGTGKTQTARLWAYGRDERHWGSAIPPARARCVQSVSYPAALKKL